MMIDRKTRSTYKGLAILALLMATIIPLSLTATVNTSRQNQQTGNLTNLARESIPPPAPTYWAKSCGGNNFDIGYCIENTIDGGYIVAGSTNSSGAGSDDFCVFKLNSTGSIVWQNTYGGSDYDDAYSIQQTTDGGYIVAGSTNSFSASGDSDAWVLKLDSTGGVTWQKTYGGTGQDVASYIQQTTDGGYIVAGITNSFGTVGYDAWVVKLNSTGGVTWQKTCGGSGDDEAMSIQQTTGGSYIVAGLTNSFGAGGYDAWVVKLNSTGGVTWQKTCGGSGDDEAMSIQQTSDGGYIVAGFTNSSGAGSDDFWVFKLNSTGSIVWQNTYGGSDYDDAYSIQQTADGGYIVAGTTYSFGVGYGDFWLLKLDSTGGVTWQNTYGGSNDDEAYYVQQTMDGGYIVAGTTSSFGVGAYNVWVVKLEADGSITWGSGSGASTSATSVTPSNSNAVTSTTSVIPANSNAIPEDTNVTPQESSATMTEQSPQTITVTPAIPTTLIVVVVVAVVLVLAAMMVFRRRAKSRARPQPVSRPVEERPAERQAVYCPKCGAMNVPEAKFCKDCGANLQR
jgi:uncharacterized delta-60 repeat protein